MSITSARLLAPMVQKLARRSPIAQAETAALLALPHRSAKVDPSTYLVREADRVENCILLLSGFAYRSKIARSGSRQILSIHLQGDLVDLHNSLLDVADHSIQALTEAQIAYIPRHAILDVVAAYPAVARAFWHDTLVDGSLFREWILNVGQRNARQRVAHLLCELALRQEEAGLCVGPNYAWPMTQEQIGDATGLTAVHVNRTVQRLRVDGLISTTKQGVTITDWPGLRKAGDFSSAYLHQPASMTA